MNQVNQMVKIEISRQLYAELRGVDFPNVLYEDGRYYIFYKPEAPKANKKGQ